MNISLISDPSTITKGRWQWNSNSHPWCKSKESHWKFYSFRENYLIEKACYDQQTKVDFGKYLVSLQELIQTKKSNSKYQRQIRRIDWIEERYFETELPKSINNKMSGSLENLIDFLSKRNQEISEFTAHFTKLENLPWNNEINLNHFIIPSLIHSLQKEFIQNPQKEKLISLFKRKFSSFEEFYKQILKAYTLNTDLSFRDENWFEIDNLLPYAFCFCKAFFNFKQKKTQTMKKGESMFLYMGTALEESARKAFDTREIRYFSWFSVTPTSTSRQVAEEFMYKSVDLQSQKLPMMFIIEIPITNEPMNYSEWIDVHKYSVHPKEKEVILAPGSVFELQEVSTDGNLVTTIKLKLINEAQALAEKKEIIQRASFHDNKEMKIMCLEGEELNETFRSLSENKLIEELEFYLCIFDNKSLGVMMKTLQTLEKIKALKFISCNFQDKGEFFNKEGNSDLLLEKIEIDEINNFYQIFAIKNKIPAAKELTLNIRNKNTQLHHIFKELGNLTQLTSLNLDFDWSSQLPSEEIQSPAFTQLTSLSLTFSNNQVNDLPNFILQRLVKLRSFSLNFKGKQQIKDGTLDLFIPYLAQLESLALNFSGNNVLADNGLKNLGLQQLTQLNSLTLNFQGCQGITNEGIRILVFEGLKYLTQLVSLNLNFSDTQFITDEGVEILATQGLSHLKKLTSLTLNFSGCQQINEQKTKSLLQELKQYQSIDINLQQQTFKISPIQSKFQCFRDGFFNKQMQFKEENKKFFAVAQKSFEIQDNPKLVTKSEFLITQHLLELTNFLPAISLIPNKEISNHFHQVKFLNLNFDNKTDEIIQILAAQGFRKLTSLISFSLNFSCSQQITDKGIFSLTSDGLRYLTQLEWLSIRFDKCNKITDKGIEFLAYNGLKYMTRLNHLALEFSPETKIEEELETMPLIDPSSWLITT